MFRRDRWLLALILALFAWGIGRLFEARFAAGDLFPVGSSLRSDALGVRAIHDAFGEALAKNVTRSRGRRGQLAAASDATIFVHQLSFAHLARKGDPLIQELTEAARQGARVVITLDDSETRVCRQTYCNEKVPTRCLLPASPEAPPPTGATQDHSCGDAALGLWGFEVGGTQGDPRNPAQRGEAAAERLPGTLPWHSPAKFIDLHGDYRVIYERKGNPLLVERPLGKGSLVLMGEGYLLSNEAQRKDRAPELLLWLVGDHPRIIFEESHLGISEPRGILSLVKELRLQGFLVGCLLFAALFAWQRVRPLALRAEQRRPLVGNLAIGESTLLSLLRRSLTPKQALLACVEEAKQAKLHSILERATEGYLQPSAQGFNRIFCPEQGKPGSK